MDPQKKDDIFRNPDMDNLHFGRHISTLNFNDKIYSAMQMGKGKTTSVLICVTDENVEKNFIPGPEGIIHHPSLCADKYRLYVTWNEYADNSWQIKFASVNTDQKNIDNIETVYSSDDMCHPPVMAFYDNKPYIAFTSIRDGNLDIYVAVKKDDIWQVHTHFKHSGIDRFRPKLAANENGLYLVWDQYKDKKYEVVFASFKNDKWQIVETLGRKDQRWLTPRVMSGKDAVYICWVVLEAVIDKLGIIDHHPYIRGAVYKDGKLTDLTDDSNIINKYNIGDLREGLLASEIYKGHVGLRRNPQLALDEDQNLYLFWEMRKETRGSDVFGRLVGRKLFGNNQWSKPAIYSSSGYSYHIADVITGSKLPVSYYFFETKDMDVVRSEYVDINQGTELNISPDKFDRWKYTALKPQAKPKDAIKLDDGKYKLVWADTHCHSNFSADAEGEPDELANFARDTAGIDIITVIDNDYYPHKALTQAEWLMHGEMSAYFTKKGNFVWLPGYEFTYHRTDLNPDFNHRCVIYPRKGGKLLRRIDPDSNTDAKMIAELKKTDGMAYPHHCSYELIGQDIEWNIEACSSWRVCLEETTCTVEKLKAGAKLGFIGSSDTHRMVPGLAGARTGLYVKELTPEALFDAYKNRRIIATQGFNIFIDFRVNEAFIGQQIQAGNSNIIKSDIKAYEKIDYVEVFRDGKSIWWDSPASEKFSFEFEDTNVGKGEHFYFMKVKLTGDPSLNVDAIPAENLPKPFEQNSRYPHNLARAQGVFAWTSPIWVNKR